MMSWLRREVFCPWLAARNGKPYRSHLPALREELTRCEDPNLRRQLQVQRLRWILNYAYNNSTFYRAHFDGAGFHPDQFGDLDDLQRVPTFEKAHIAGNQDAIRAAGIAETDLLPTATGGTTGNSFRFWYDRACVARRDAMTVLANAAYDWHPGDPAAMVWNAHQDLPSGAAGFKHRLRSWLGWRYQIIDATEINEERLEAWCREMRARRTEVVYGYAASVKEIAAYLDATEQRVPTVRLVVTTAEPLFAADRALVEKVFACPVRDRYASREVGPMAQEDGDGHWRYFANSMFLEVEGDAGEAGDVLVTDYWNVAFPFIRYRIGDTAVLDPTGADAVGLPIMGSLTGRQTDFLITIGGARVSGMTFHAAYVDEATHECGSDAFDELQFRQSQRDAILVRIVPGPTFEREADETRLTRIVRSILGGEMRVDFEYPESIGRTASGKYRFTVNELES